MARSFDLAVVGTGTAATVAALRVQAEGWRVAVIDWRPYGGTCALRGCDPKKVLVGAAAGLDHARRMFGKGLVGDITIHWPELMAFKRRFTDHVPAEHEELYREHGIECLHGTARFLAPTTLEVNGERIEARHILLAAGAEPVRMNIPGEEHLVTSETFLSLSDLPRRIVLVGGGYIAAEFSHIAAHAGAQVTILQRADRLLTGFDSDLVGWLMPAFDALGVEVRLGTTVTAVDKKIVGFRVHARSREGESTFDADLVVHAAGRAPALQALDLETGGIAHDHGRLQLSEHLQSLSNPAVYAAGDSAQAGPSLTPVASHDAKIVAANLLHGNHHKPDYRGAPSVVFTIPPLAKVGLTEAQAREKNLKFKVHAQQTSDWFTARQAAEPVYGYKVLVEEDSDHILGAHLVGPHAEETINLFAIAMRHDLKATDLKHTILAYPTSASDIGYMV